MSWVTEAYCGWRLGLLLGMTSRLVVVAERRVRFGDLCHCRSQGIFLPVEVEAQVCLSVASSVFLDPSEQVLQVVVWRLLSVLGRRNAFFVASVQVSPVETLDVKLESGCWLFGEAVDVVCV